MKTIVVADDDPISRRLIERSLTKWGYDVIVACDGEEALKVFNYTDAARIAILDWMMPKVDGIEVCRQIRRRTSQPYVYIILLTAKTQREDLLQGLEVGADDYITKPFDANELKARLRVACRIIDLQEELLSMQKELRVQATHDFLTGLPNRLLFSDRLSQKIAAARRNHGSVGVMFLDVDRFKVVNDALGHSFGDILLKQVAERLASRIRESDTVARSGGDEFTFILSDIKTPTDATAAAQRIIDSFSVPFEINSHQIYVTASIGISIYPQHGEDVETLVKNADSAMYHAKSLGGNRYQMCNETVSMLPAVQMKMENELRQAIEKGQLVLAYQPRVDLKTGAVLGAEALIRWQHPELGLLFPDRFVPLAEETGLIVPIGEWVLKEACKQNKQWQEMGLPPIEMTVNVSPKQVQQANFLEVVKSALDESGLDPQYLGLEITETVLMSTDDSTIKLMNELREMNVRVSIDDFGKGNSSLNYLTQLPTDAIKIDESFIRNVVADPDAAAITGAVIAMAHSLKLRVVAEGIETLDQLEFLRSLNCDEIQGYFVSRPVEPESLAHILRTNAKLEEKKRAA